MSQTITRIVIDNYKCFHHLDLPINGDLTLLVGDNETGKSTIIEAINLCLTQELFGRNISFDISPYLFNRDCVLAYLENLKAGQSVPPPSILIELYFVDSQELAYLKGTNNSLRMDVPGVKLSVEYDHDFADEYAAYIADPEKLKNIPTEYYRVHWYAFSHNAITKRGLKVSSTLIDTTTIRLQHGSDYYIQKIIDDSLNPKERAELAVEYRRLKELFGQQASFTKINEKLQQQQGIISKKNLQVSIDVSQRTNWETTLTSYLDEIPFQHIGKGDQSILKMLIALDRRGPDSHVILIEEPENHLSFSNLAYLISRVSEQCSEKQVLLSTHSTFVLNKLGLENVKLLGDSHQAASLKDLPIDTQDYFKKLPGYDTLRLIVARRPILVEGPSDELVLQKAYLQTNGHLPLQDGIDIISVRGLAFKRFLDIAALLSKQVVVVTDNDGDFKSNVEDKYVSYFSKPHIRFCYSKDNTLATLENHIVALNDLATLNAALERNDPSPSDALGFMLANKAESALRLFETRQTITFPQYILDAYGQQ